MRKAYKTDLTNAQWELIRDIIPAPTPKPGCAPTDVREVVNALLYQNKAGCQWDMMPHDLLPKSTAFDYFTRWRQDGTWDRLLDALRRKAREAAGRDPEPTAAAADSQSVPSTQVGGEQRGYDGGKKVKGRKRHILNAGPFAGGGGHGGERVRRAGGPPAHRAGGAADPRQPGQGVRRRALPRPRVPEVPGDAHPDRVGGHGAAGGGEGFRGDPEAVGGGAGVRVADGVPPPEPGVRPACGSQ